MRTAFPQAPLPNPGFQPPTWEGTADKGVTEDLIRGLLAKCANGNSAGEDRITYGILKTFYEWTPTRFTNLHPPRSPPPPNGRQQEAWSYRSPGK